MIEEGDIVLFRFPQTDQSTGKLRPALLLKRIPNDFDDWLVCMISSRLEQQIEQLEVVVKMSEPESEGTGLKRDSLIRSTRLAVVDATVFEGKLGKLPGATFVDIRRRLASWISS